MTNIGFNLCAKPQSKRDTSVRAKVVNRWTTAPSFGPNQEAAIVYFKIKVSIGVGEPNCSGTSWVAFHEIPIWGILVKTDIMSFRRLFASEKYTKYINCGYIF